MALAFQVSNLAVVILCATASSLEASTLALSGADLTCCDCDNIKRQVFTINPLYLVIAVIVAQNGSCNVSVVW